MAAFNVKESHAMCCSLRPALSVLTSLLILVYSTHILIGILDVPSLTFVARLSMPRNQSKSNIAIPKYVYTDESTPTQPTMARYLQHQFVSQFKKWEEFMDPGIGDDVPDDVDRYLIYRCDSGQMSFCGGWGDRLKGVIFSYLLANLTGRVFKAEFLNPNCDMSNYLLPNKVNWSHLVSSGFPENKTEFEIIRHRNNHELKHRIYKTDFSKVIDPALKYVYFQSNLEHTSGLMKNVLYAKHLSWMKGMSPADVYAAVYKRLFRLAPMLEKRVDKVLSNTLKSPSNRLICIHVRMGANPTLKHDTVVRNNVANLPKIWSFITSQIKTKYDKVFVMSDDKRVQLSARTFFNNRLVTIPGTIVHIDQPGDSKDKVMCEGFEKLLVEHHVMMNCDVMVRGQSGLSVLASAVRGTDEQLFCLRASGNVERCVRNEFDDFL